jgi:hypothetical protein
MVDADGNIVDKVGPFSTRVVEARAFDGGPSFTAANPVAYMQMVSSEAELSQSMETSGSISASGWGASVSASGSYMQASMSKSTHVYMAVGAYVEQAGESHTYFQPPCLSCYALRKLGANPLPKSCTKRAILNSKGAGVATASSGGGNSIRADIESMWPFGKTGEAAFEEEFGKYFISGFKRQAWYMAVLDVQTNTTSDQTSARAALQASYKGAFSAEGKASASAVFQSMAGQYTVSVKAQASGWAAQYLSEFPSTQTAMMDGVSYFVRNVDLSAAIPMVAILTPYTALPHYAWAVGRAATCVNCRSLPNTLSTRMVQVRKWLVELENMQQRALAMVEDLGGSNSICVVCIPSGEDPECPKAASTPQSQDPDPPPEPKPCGRSREDSVTESAAQTPVRNVVASAVELIRGLTHRSPNTTRVDRWLRVYDACSALVLEVRPYARKGLDTKANASSDPAPEFPTCKKDESPDDSVATWLSFRKEFAVVLTYLRVAMQCLERLKGGC